MNLNNQPTIDQLARLFASRKDSHDDHILWINQAGDVRLDARSPYTDERAFSQARPELFACLKMYRRGQGYVGKKAAADQDFMGRVLQALKAEWASHQALAKSA
ncbi:hypothetical protein [Pseudomonas gingeri]|uniref:Uncharacterized protein n=1 Tax=Pseudomonas gingeri TaxID=117681 RepID=A0A7Y7YCA1_9PSED|nr:hypothetical protein [Pseudomonas gingeri]NVZ99515.1 hypothetical protein [Pseudomonas gingeri]NWA15463.1 hypothetical protein [Pseudomonas gingeri]NWA56690.1 hypothetical protein [Pseudomonas gingeri]NWA95184.1 hypothetical protein [Pseudomonas gingeri]NWB05266.1 hypothetical protein [Pseudomonas gingeri]